MSDLPALAELARTRDELLSLITVPPPPRRSADVQGYHAVDVIERAIKVIDAAVALATGGAADTARVRGILDASPLDHYPNRPTRLELILCGGASVACYDGDKLAALDRWLANRANGTPTTAGKETATGSALESVAAASHPAARSLTPERPADVD